MKPNFISLGAACAALGVGLGAFGAHGLRSVLGAAQLGQWETATRYWQLGALGMLLSACFNAHAPVAPRLAGCSFWAAPCLRPACTLWRSEHRARSERSRHSAGSG